MSDTYAIFVVEAVADLVNEDGFDLLRTGRPRLTDAAAQVWVPNADPSKAGYVEKARSVATKYAEVLEHPALPRWAIRTNKEHDDADLLVAVIWWEARPAWRTRLLAGPNITPPVGQAWPDGGTDTRPNRLWRVDAATTTERYERLVKNVRPPVWSAVTTYAQGDTVRTGTGPGLRGWRCQISNTNSEPIVGNANWSPFLGPLPASWSPVLP
jgi:hypothetical protein